jgi:hypothetical protein
MAHHQKKSQGTRPLGSFLVSGRKSRELRLVPLLKHIFIKKLEYNTLPSGGDTMKFAGVGLVMLAAVCWGISGGIADILMTKSWDPIVISLYRGAVGFICFLAWLLFRFKQKDLLRPFIHMVPASGYWCCRQFHFLFFKHPGFEHRCCSNLNVHSTCLRPLNIFFVQN